MLRCNGAGPCSLTPPEAVAEGWRGSQQHLIGSEHNPTSRNEIGDVDDLARDRGRAGRRQSSVWSGGIRRAPGLRKQLTLRCGGQRAEV